MKRNKLHILYLLILAVFFLIIADGLFHFYRGGKLKGAFNRAVKPQWSFNSWFEGTYQDEYSKYLEEHIGFRNFLVRLNNQINYYLFDFARANLVFVGQDDYLYEEGYVNTYYGRDFIGSKKTVEFARKTKFVQDKLKLRGIDLVVVFAPGKGAFYPDNIPDSKRGEPTDSINYKVFSSSFSDYGINVFDCYDWFLKMKDTSRYPLYPKTGIHWSYYGEVLVQDSLIEYLTDLTSLNLGSLKIDSLSRTPANESNDNDIEKSMNLLFDIPNLNMIYPHYHLEKGEDNIRGLVVADSYYWGIFNKGFSKYFLNQGQFWYYNESIHQLGKPNRKVEEVSLKDEIEKHEVIIILTTDVNLYQFSFGFIDELYELYDVPKEQEYKELVDMYIKRINGTPSWKEKVKQQAEENGKDLDQMILENAQYMVWIATKPQ